MRRLGHKPYKGRHQWQPDILCFLEWTGLDLDSCLGTMASGAGVEA